MTPRKIGGKDGILGEEQFQQMVRLERKRAQRSGKPFLMVYSARPGRLGANAG